MNLDPIPTILEMKMIAEIDFKNLDRHEIEEEISKGSIPAMRFYGEQAAVEFADDPTELDHRKNLLLEAPHNGHTHILRHVAMLAAMTQDLDMSKFVIGELEEMGDPAMGYYAFREAENKILSKEDLDNWQILLNSSASKGHIQAKRYAHWLRLEKFGALRPILAVPYNIWLLLNGIMIAFKNPRDLRLPPKTVGSSKQA